MREETVDEVVHAHVGLMVGELARLQQRETQVPITHRVTVLRIVQQRNSVRGLRQVAKFVSVDFVFRRVPRGVRMRRSTDRTVLNVEGRVVCTDVQWEVGFE